MDKLIHGDSAEELKKLEDNSVDLVCTDPPYGYSFMGKNWDKAVPSVEIWKECLRVLKPGGFAFVMSAPRQDVLSQMIVRITEAGFDTDFTSIYWTYASGFPKAANIGKMVDKRLGAMRPIIKTIRTSSGGMEHVNKHNASQDYRPNNYSDGENVLDITTAATPQAKALDGSYGGFQPKPAVEVIIVAMKPLSEKTFVDQALKNGKGVTWLDDCRVPTNANLGRPQGSMPQPMDWGKSTGLITQGDERGRFPANLLVSDDVIADHSRFFDLEAWASTLPFLITPKPSKAEKNEGLSHLPVKQSTGGGGPSSAHGSIKAPGQNFHPTVKPLKLMRYLITLGSRQGDTVLEPFMGSGTTCLAAKNLNRRYIGIERETQYVDIARARLKATVN